MAFLRSSTGQDSAVTLRGRGVWLRAPLMGDYAPWAELRAHEPRSPDAVGAGLAAR